MGVARVRYHWSTEHTDTCIGERQSSVHCCIILFSEISQQLKKVKKPFCFVKNWPSIKLQRQHSISLFTSFLQFGVYSWKLSVELLFLFPVNLWALKSTLKNSSGESSRSLLPSFEMKLWLNQVNLFLKLSLCGEFSVA